MSGNGYLFLGVGNDQTGVLQFFALGQEREAEAWAADAAAKSGLAYGIKRIELAESQLLSMMNANLLLQAMLRAESGRRAAS